MAVCCVESVASGLHLLTAKVVIGVGRCLNPGIELILSWLLPATHLLSHALPDSKIRAWQLIFHTEEWTVRMASTARSLIEVVLS